MTYLSTLIIGSGGREHALAWALASSPQVGRIYVAPGNAGSQWPAAEKRAAAENVELAVNDFAALIAFAQEKAIGLTVVGPEVPLSEGIVDAFQAAGLNIFGPRQAAAQLEASKAFAKQFMVDHHIPTAAYGAFSDYDAAHAYLATLDGPVVVKASGLAAGKGVIVCDDRAQAENALQQIMHDRAFGAAGDQVLIEERLSGPELSVLAFSDGRSVVTMPHARDHKRVFENDEGPNTGGMGAYAPTPDIDADFINQVREQILQPTIDGLAAQGTPYVGVLYAGLMLTPAGPKVLEFNCRFGDPETQVILPLLETDLAEIMQACIDGRLDRVAIEWRPGACATVVMASPGYPGSYPKGRSITGLDAANSLPDVTVFQAGTALAGDQIVTAGGRVLAVSATGPDLPAALRQAYQGVAAIEFEGAHYRRDIGGTWSVAREA